MTGTVHGVNPWMQKLVPAASIEVFDGDSKGWPRFIAGFKSMVHDALSSDADRLAILAQLLSPRLREGFAGLLATPTMYHRVLEELQQLYGDPEATVQLQATATALLNVEPLHSDTLSELERFYLQVKGPVCVFETSGRNNELESAILVGQVSGKLTKNLQEKWAHRIQSRSTEARSLRHFTEWLKAQVIEKRVLATFVNPKQGGISSASRGKPKTATDSKLVRTTAVLPVRQCIVCKTGGHNIASCPTFARMDMTERLAIIRERRLCIRCLRAGHLKRQCISKGKCSIQGCNGVHHSLLHGAPRMYPNRERQPNPTVPTGEERTKASITTARVNWQSNNVQVLCAVVPVVVKFGENSCRAFALLDSGAEVSMMSEKLAEKLQMHGVKRTFNVRTITGSSQMSATECQCIISATDGSTSFNVDPVIVMPKLDLSTRSVRLTSMQST
uniref:CCHC-type domain-containing protein n=1 Tax=Trichuris muris TaxID=70415 RepID=A0A5S6QR19_TRIMR